MFKPLAASILIAALSACTPQDRSGTAQADVSGIPCGSGYNPLPAGLCLPAASHLREDRFYVAKKKGHLRRKVVLEILDRESGQSIEDIERLMHVAGYRVSGEPKSSRKATKLKFKRRKSPSITVEFRPDPGKKPANPRARHLVVFTWKVANSLDQWMADRQ